MSGREVVLMSFLDSGEADHPFFEIDGVDVRFLAAGTQSKRTLGKVAGNITRILRVRRQIKKIRPDVVVSFLTQLNVISIIAGIGLPTRIIVSERNQIAGRKEKVIWDLLRRIIYPFATKVTANSREILEELRCRNIRDGVLVRNLIRMPKQTLVDRDESRPLVLNVGRLVHQKNQSLLLDAFHASNVRQLGWQLALLGSGPERMRLERYAKELRIEDDVVFAGEVSDVTFWFKRARIFVMTSRFEGMPNAVLEAMSHRLAVLTTSTCGGVAELISSGENGFVVPPSSELIGRYIYLLAEDEEKRQSIGEAAFESVRKYDASNAVNDWLLLEH